MPTKPGPWLTVIGVSADLDQEPNETAPNPLVFVPFRQENNDGMWIMVSSPSSPTSLISAIRTAVQNQDQDLPLSQVRTISDPNRTDGSRNIRGALPIEKRQ